MVGFIECDESGVGPARPSGLLGPRNRGRGTHEQPVFGIFEHGGQVFTEPAPDVTAKTLRVAIRGKAGLASSIVTNGWRGYDGPVHINGIESFWS